MTKNILIGLVLTMVSALSFAQNKQNDLVFITDSDNGNTEWYGASTTFKMHNDGYSMMVVQKNAKTKATISRMFVGVMVEHCKVGYGSLKGRETLEQEWKTIAQFSIATGESVADIVGGTICEVGAMMLKDKAKNSSNI